MPSTAPVEWLDAQRVVKRGPNEKVVGYVPARTCSDGVWLLRGLGTLVTYSCVMPFFLLSSHPFPLAVVFDMISLEADGYQRATKTLRTRFVIYVIRRNGWRRSGRTAKGRRHVSRI